jgi:hypothetical protein
MEVRLSIQFLLIVTHHRVLVDATQNLVTWRTQRPNSFVLFLLEFSSLKCNHAPHIVHNVSSRALLFLTSHYIWSWDIMFSQTNQSYGKPTWAFTFGNAFESVHYMLHECQPNNKQRELLHKNKLCICSI